MQRLLFEDVAPPTRLKTQLLKWIGNKQRFAGEIVSYFPSRIGRYFEPFLGSGAVLATLAPKRALGSDSFAPLMEIWRTLKQSPESLKSWYTERWQTYVGGDRTSEYERIRGSYNANPNGADLLFLCRACYGGVVRFRKADGHISTPIGIHDPISPESFARRVDEWHRRTAGAEFLLRDYEQAMADAQEGDLVYCDPPYRHSQGILYGAQDFNLEHLLSVIEDCRARGVFVALSIDGKKRSGNLICSLPIPRGLFEREVFISCGRSMLKRFQMNGRSLEGEGVSDRLLLTY
ncbi:MAG TPA: Dam family site-specific DNA-(adenine-N6)-methyltransferase [Phycisphaerae bacterium]|nr:Dam family site-specific DNA-(adenine-N6)-methyltransferase [Phycisphaerae bacterium]